MQRKPSGGVYALVRGRGRVWVESFNSLKGTARVRFDPGEGMRSRAETVKLTDIDWRDPFREEG